MFPGNKKIAYTWTFTNERLSRILPLTNFKDKKIVGISGSGDQGISFLMKGADSYLGIDKNILAYLFCEFKITALANLELDEFKQIFGLSPSAAGLNLYTQKIRPNLSKETADFFDKILLVKNNLSIFQLLKRSRYFYKDSWPFGRKADYVPYLKSAENWKKAKQGIRKFKLMKADIKDGLKRVQEKVDLIYLSDIFDGKNYGQIFEVLQVCNRYLSSEDEIIIAHYNYPKEIKHILEKLSYQVRIIKPRRIFWRLFLPSYDFYLVYAQK